MSATKKGKNRTIKGRRKGQRRGALCVRKNENKTRPRRAMAVARLLCLFGLLESGCLNTQLERGSCCTVFMAFGEGFELGRETLAKFLTIYSALDVFVS